MPTSRKSVVNCEEYSHIESVYNFCKGFDDINKTKINNFLRNFNFSNNNIHNSIQLKDKIISYLLNINNKKDFLKGKNSFTKKKN